MRPLIELHEHLWLDIPDLDDDHTVLANSLNELAELTMRQACALDCQMTILERLEQETAKHFEREERYMIESGYDGLVSHQREHQMLHAELVDFIRQIRSGHETLQLHALQALKFWLIDHILHADKVFADYYALLATDSGEQLTHALGQSVSGEH